MTQCPNCGGEIDPRIHAQAGKLAPVVRQIYREHVDADPGDRLLCPDCALALARAAERRRSDTSLHTTTDPNTTFPYYHPAEETVLSQAERMAHHPGFTGQDVTMAFIDSGFYPHPDLLEGADWHEAPGWTSLSPAGWRALLRERPTRLLDYVDLRRDRPEIERYGLDAPGLWDDHWLSWHGEMTSVIAAGNGAMSGGRFHGLAPRARIVGIAIGDGHGRIPESDILAGLQWLLHDDNWERYGVRVVNMSVGGDYPQHWTESAVCLAADELSRRGVLVLAAAGNSGADTLVAPAQTPTVLTVGGYDDRNRRWSPANGQTAAHLQLYHHNRAPVDGVHGAESKPELLAPARYVPSPILPPTWVLRETHAIDRLRQTLQGEDPRRLQTLLAHWHRVMHEEADGAEIAQLAGAYAGGPSPSAGSSHNEIWRALRKRMNAHKWVHACYQHADGTSVAVAQVSAVAAQMAQANHHLDGAQIRTLLLATAWEHPLWTQREQGQGLLQPAAAVAAALRAPGGVLVGFPVSGTLLHESRLRKWLFQGTLTRRNLVDLGGSSQGDYAYLGLYAPTAVDVSVIGPFNDWTIGHLPLERTPVGWWHGAVRLPPGEHPYRFWVRDQRAPDGRWLFDPENPHRIESGYDEPHTVLQIPM